MKQMVTVLSLIALAAAALFWKQVWSVFAGMTVLESLEMIVQFLLHIAVGTILFYGLTTIPELIKPWMRALRQKRRALRRGRGMVQGKESAIKPHKLTVDQLLGVLAPTQKIQKTTVQPQEDRVDLNL